MISLTTGQELKLSVQNVDTTVTSKNKSIRYLNPLAANSVDKNLTGLARDLFANSQNTYKSTRGTIDIGYLNEN